MIDTSDRSQLINRNGPCREDGHMITLSRGYLIVNLSDLTKPEPFIDILLEQLLVYSEI